MQCGLTRLQTLPVLYAQEGTRTKINYGISLPQYIVIVNISLLYVGYVPREIFFDNVQKPRTFFCDYLHPTEKPKGRSWYAFFVP